MRVKIILILITLLVFTSSSFAITTEFDGTGILTLNEFNRYLGNENNKLIIESNNYFKNLLNKKELVNIIESYQKVYPNKNDAYEILKSNLISTYQEIEVNNFSEAQAKALLISSVKLETGNATKSEMVYSKDIPKFAPSHKLVENEKLGLSLNYDFDSTFLADTDDLSSRTSYETTGLGYEVKSSLGFNKTTAFLEVGSCNITTPQGKAGYMFNTIYYGGQYQDIGIGYYNGGWKAIVSGYWTGWGSSSIDISSGDKLYFKLWIGTDNKINFQILDGNDFNNIIFQNSYSTNNEIPSSGSGVGFNRQITLVDTSHNPTSGLYLKNASFDLAYLYNNTSYSLFKDTNTSSSRRGKFGCSWASDSKVTILSNTHWSAEEISIIMQ